MNNTEMAQCQSRMSADQMLAMIKHLVDAKRRWRRQAPVAQIVALRVAQEVALVCQAWPILAQIRAQNRERQA